MKGLFKFKTGDLVTIGLFTGAAKTIAFIIALMGGGMNPATLIIKNAVYAALLVIMLVKVHKPGALFTSVILSTLISLLLFGQLMIFFPATFICCIFVEVIIYFLTKAVPRLVSICIGIALFEFLSTGVSLVVSFLRMRENPDIMIPIIVIIGIGYFGILIGLFLGSMMLKELRHAGLIQS